MKHGAMVWWRTVKHAKYGEQAGSDAVKNCDWRENDELAKSREQAGSAEEWLRAYDPWRKARTEQQMDDL